MGTHERERESHVRDFTMVEVRALRKRTEDAVDALLALLDELEDDADLEPAGDEDDFSMPEGWRGVRQFGAHDDAEDSHDAEDNRDDLEPDADGEPEMGML